MKVTVLMPCRNEAECLPICINQAFELLNQLGVSGEVLVADNASSDNSKRIAEEHGARVIDVFEVGYGSTLQKGIESAKGEYVVMADSDRSYNFVEGVVLVQLLDSGAQLAIGNRFAGGIEKGAMPFSHRWIGNPILSAFGRFVSKSKIHDFHCGLRACKKSDILALNLSKSGMEYATEMIVEAELKGYIVKEAPVTLSRDIRTGKPHLRSIPDGLRHLRYMISILFSTKH